MTFVPVENASKVRKALGDVGAGVIGEYNFCSFSVTGTGRFKPSSKASPHIGVANVLEEVQEERIEVVCDRRVAKKAIKALKAAHPYEETAFELSELIEEEDL